MSAVSDFVARFFPQAQAVSAQTGLPVDYVLGQAGLESGWGTSNAATLGNNFFGISPGGSLASYASPDAGFAAFGNLMGTNQYAGVSSVAGQGPQAIGDYLNSQGYSTTPDYGSRVAGAVSAVDSVLGGSSPTTGTPGSSPPSGGSPTAAAGGTAGTTSTGAASTGCGLNPACYLSSLATFLGGYATRAALILVAILLLLGAVYLFASRTQQVAAA